MQFLYMGFEHQANSRHFRFQGVLPKERSIKPPKHLDFTLTADMSLLARYKISIQDAPKLCLQILGAAVTGSEDNAIQFASYAITLADVSAFASARSAIEGAKVARRKPRTHFKPAASSQLKWPQYR